MRRLLVGAAAVVATVVLSCGSAGAASAVPCVPVAGGAGAEAGAAPIDSPTVGTAIQVGASSGAPGATGTPGSTPARGTGSPLAFTGTDAVVSLLVGLALVAAGGGMVLMGRLGGRLPRWLKRSGTQSAIFVGVLAVMLVQPVGMASAAPVAGAVSVADCSGSGDLTPPPALAEVPVGPLLPLGAVAAFAAYAVIRRRSAATDR